MQDKNLNYVFINQETLILIALFLNDAVEKEMFCMF